MEGVSDRTRHGQRWAIDDGTFAGTIQACDADEIVVKITHTPEGGGRLRAEKGINLPDTELPTLAGQTDEDLRALAAAAELADIIGLSFVSRPTEILHVLRELEALAPHRTPGIVLKLETERAFNALHQPLCRALAAGVPSGGIRGGGRLAIA